MRRGERAYGQDMPAAGPDRGAEGAEPVVRPTPAPAAGLRSLDTALARCGDGAFVIAGDGRIILWNPAAERIMGHRTRDVLGRQCCDVFVGRDEHGNRLCYQGCHVMTLVRMEEPVQSFDMETRTRGGQPVWLNVSVLTLPGPGSSSAGFTVHLFRDVTASRELLDLVRSRVRIPAAPPPDAVQLTRRELDVLRLLSEGVSTPTVADRLHVSRATVRNHIQNLLGKLGVHSRLEAVAYAHRHGLI